MPTPFVSGCLGRGKEAVKGKGWRWRMAAAAGIGDAWKGAQHTSSNGVFLSRGTSARTHAETNLHVMYVRTVQLIGPSVCRFYNSM